MCGKQGVQGRLGVQHVYVSCGMKRRHYARSKTPVMCKCPFQSKIRPGATVTIWDLGASKGLGYAVQAV